MDDVRALARELVDVPNRLRRLEGRRHLEHSTVTVDGQEVPIPEAIRRIRAAETNLAATIQATADARAIADGKVDCFFGATAPASADEGDFWTDADGNVHQYRSGSWQPVTSTTVQQAMNAASQAQSAADGKISTFLQSTPPAAGGVGDLWIRSVDNRKHRWSGSAWVELKDHGITDAANAAVAADTKAGQAQNAATAADTKAVAAQTAADSADAKATTAQSAANAAQSTANTAVQTSQAANTTALQALHASTAKGNLLRNSEFRQEWLHSSYSVFNYWRGGKSTVGHGGLGEAPKPAPLGPGVRWCGDGTAEYTFSVFGTDTPVNQGNVISRGVWIYCETATTIILQPRWLETTGGYAGTDAATSHPVPAGVWTWVSHSLVVSAARDGKCPGLHIGASMAGGVHPKFWFHRPIVAVGETVKEWSPNPWEQHAWATNADKVHRNADLSVWRWPLRYPFGWANWGTGPVRVVDGHLDYGASFDVQAAGAGHGMYKATTFLAGLSDVHPDAKFFTVELDVSLIAGSFNGAGMRLDIMDAAGTWHNHYIPLNSLVASPAAGKRYDIVHTFSRPVSAATWQRYQFYFFANYNHSLLGGQSVKNLTVHRLRVRHATDAEGEALQAKIDAAVADQKAVAADSKATSAQNTANTAKSDAATADGKAVQAKTVADAARATANTAKTDAAAADSKAVQARIIADRKAMTFRQATTPTASTVGDMWVRTSDQRIHRWDGSTWVECKDADIAVAKSAADSAKSTADSAATTASQADQKATAATTTANTAKNTADSATSTANTAKSTADNAAATAANADQKATTATSTATTAVNAANTAKSIADGAKSTADTAKTTADTAKSTADSATTTANQADQKATAATTTANTADNKATQALEASHVTTNLLHNTEFHPQWSTGPWPQFNYYRSGGGATGGDGDAPKPAPLGAGVRWIGTNPAGTTPDWAVFATDTPAMAGDTVARGVWVFAETATTVQLVRRWLKPDGTYAGVDHATNHPIPAGVWTWIHSAATVPANRDQHRPGLHILNAKVGGVCPKVWFHRPVVGVGDIASKWVPHKDEPAALADPTPAGMGNFALWRTFDPVPHGWARWGTDTLQKVSLPSGHDIRWAVNATTDAGINSSSMCANMTPGSDYFTATVEFTLHSGSLDGFGVRIDAHRAGSTSKEYLPLPIASEMPTPTHGRRQRVTVTRKWVRAHPTTGWTGWVFANYAYASWGFTRAEKDITVHSVEFRNATSDERAAVDARILVDGKNSVRWEATTPVGVGQAAGDVWYRRDAAADIVGIWRWDGTAWKPKTLANEVVSSLTADKLRTGTLTAGTVITAGPATGVHTTIKPEGITTFGADGKTELIQLGSGSQDRLAIADNASRIVSSINADGSASFKTVSVDDVLLNTADWTGSGGSLLELMDRRPRGVVAFGGRYTDSNASTGETPIYEVAFTAQKNRLYRISTSSHRVDSGAPDALMVIRLRMEHSQWVAPDAPMFVASAPSTSSTILTEAIQSTGPDKITALNVSKFHQFTTDPNVTNGHYQSHVRLLVSLVAFGSNTARLVANVQNGKAASPAEIVVEDIGPARGNFASIIDQTNVPPTPPPQSHTLTRTALWVSSFRGNGSLRTDTSDAMQGQTPYYTPNGNHKSYVGFNDVTSELNGSTVEKVEIYLYAGQTHYGSGGQGVIGTHGVATKPSTVPAAVSDRTRQHFNRGQGRWIDITGLGKDDWKTGATRGLALGPGPTTDPLHYIRFDGTSGNKPQLRITYRK